MGIQIAEKRKRSGHCTEDTGAVLLYKTSKKPQPKTHNQKLHS